MSGRRIDTFFYGPFMDTPILLACGVSEPPNPRRAFVADFQLHIGQHATLVPRAGSRAYRMLFALPHTELELLYAAPGLETYRAEAILVQPFDDIATPALCYAASVSSRVAQSRARRDALVAMFRFARSGGAASLNSCLSGACSKAKGGRECPL